MAEKKLVCVPIHTFLQEESEEGQNDANLDERKAEESQNDPSQKKSHKDGLDPNSNLDCLGFFLIVARSVAFIFGVVCIIFVACWAQYRYYLDHKKVCSSVLFRSIFCKHYLMDTCIIIELILASSSNRYFVVL